MEACPSCASPPTSRADDILAPPLPGPLLRLPRPVRALAPTAVVLLVLVPLAAQDPEFGPTDSPRPTRP
ncbi:hypothetical protein ACFV1W_16740 [Kitasatospora sp. NPDC059648]|uniref:hypothetical protein n=1 Tax=Kitasatospora sp. NPDC059648 TaxID=3346894 RepID=UPI0036A21331